MTREEEIKARLETYTVFAEMDIKYLLARNEELQRKVIGHKFISEQRANDVKKLQRRVDELEHLKDCVVWERECEAISMARGMRKQIRSIHGSSKSAEAWTNNGRLSVWRIHSESRFAVRDAIAAIDAKEQPNDQAD